MRILEIRGRNMASLAGDWEVRFDSGPLAKAGTFAITGPTGAGKSTIFDALCLALFANTPRYQGGQSYHVGDTGQDEKDKLRAADPRSILRRGTSEGYAETEFTDKNGAHFRAKWVVKRAGGSPKGRMQPAVHSLVNVATGQAELGREAVDKQVEKLLGFTQEQFVRAVLLPQGEFAAFLKAKAEHRANVLEALTNSAIFGQIGAKSFEKAANARTVWELEQSKQQAILVLTPEERAATLSRRQELGELAKVEKAAIDAARIAVQWFARQAELDAAVGVAQAQLDAPVAANEAAKSRWARLVAIDAAAPFRECFESAKTAENAAQAAEKHASSEKSGLDEATAALAAQGPAYESAVKRAKAAQNARAETEPALREARRRDEEIAALGRTLSAQRATAEQLTAAFTAADTRAREAKTSLESAELLAATTATWLVEHTHLAALVADWALYETRLQSFAKAKVAVQNEAAELPKLTEQVTAQSNAAGRAVAHEAECQGKLAAAKHDREHAESVAKTFDEVDLQERRKSLSKAQVQLAQLAELVTQSAFLFAEIERTQAEAATASAAETEFGRAAEHEAKTASEYTIRLQEAREAHSRAQQTADLAEHRGELTPGEACPLCGATEHPYAESDPLAERMLAGQVKRIAELETALRRSSTAQISFAEKARAAHAVAARAASESQRFRVELGISSKKWNEAGFDGAPDSAALAPKQAAWMSEQAALQAVEDSAVKARKLLELGTLAERQAQAALEQSTALRNKAEVALESARARVREAEQSLQRQTELRNESERELAPAFLGWPMWEARLHADPRGFSSACADNVAEFRRQSQVATQLSTKITKEKAELQGLLALAVAAEKQLSDAQRVLGETASAQSEAKIERTKLLGNEAAAVVEKRLTDEVTTAQVALDAAQAELRRIETDVATRTGLSSAADAVARKSRELAAQRTDERDTALLAAGRSLAETEAHLAHDPAGVESERRSLATLLEAVKTAQQTLAAREADRAEHATTPRPVGDAADASTALEHAESSAVATTLALGAVDAKLQADEHAHQRRGALDAELQTLKQAKDRWETLCNVIGDKQGKRFRLFAQSITLDLLIARANRHLSQLAPRYLLQRVPNAELELQVIDRDNADDIRSIASLSGGETFLASLALALGLSSIAAKNLHIGSLFIDEGFGTLDAATLQLAVEVLNGLHATGRQVGIISHVDGLADQLGGWIQVKKLTSTRSEIQVGSNSREDARRP